MRLLKVLTEQKKYPWKGRLLEMGVLSFQQANKAATTVEIREEMVRVWNKAPALPANLRDIFMREVLAHKNGERNLFGYPEDSKLVGGGIGGIWVLAVRLEALVAVLNGACGMLI